MLAKGNDLIGANEPAQFKGFGQLDGTCSDTVQGIRSPEAFFPLDRLLRTD